MKWIQKFHESFSKVDFTLQLTSDQFLYILIIFIYVSQIYIRHEIQVVHITDY